MTLRLSSACSNQLSYRPDRVRSLENGGKGIRTPDIQLAKLALYQLSYAPVRLLIRSTIRAGSVARRLYFQQTLDSAFFA